MKQWRILPGFSSPPHAPFRLRALPRLPGDRLTGARGLTGAAASQRRATFNYSELAGGLNLSAPASARGVGSTPKWPEAVRRARQVPSFAVGPFTGSESVAGSRADLAPNDARPHSYLAGCAYAA